jgi:peptidoglycan/xylan/chitin deacetylase (PgdA/CDA1 family)
MLSPLARFIPLKWLIKQSGQRLIFPFYHTVCDALPVHLKFLYNPKNVKEFKDDLEFLLRNFSPVSPDILKEPEKIVHINKPSFILSFDDGLSEVADIIAPILLEKGIPAIFFLNNDFIDNTQLFFRFRASILAQELMSRELSPNLLHLLDSRRKTSRKVAGSIVQLILEKNNADDGLMDDLAASMGIDFDDYLRKTRPYLNTQQVHVLKYKGFHLGAHSRNHPDFSTLSPEDQYAEIKSSTQDIRHKFSLDYSYFAFPFSDEGVSNATLRKIYSSEERILDAGFGTSGLKKRMNLPHFQRISLETPKIPARNILQTRYVNYLLKGVAGKNRDTRSL